MLLITTAEERTWKKDEKIIFLGGWCKLYSRKHIWSKLNYKLVPYHWDDRDKYYEDYKYLSEVYERYLKVLSKTLNNIHGLNYSVRYWRIVIGPWLRFFIDTIYDRYCSIKSAIEAGNVSSTLIMGFDIDEWIPKDYNQFYQTFTTDQWNHFIYGEIIKLVGSISYEVIGERNHPNVNYNKRIYGGKLGRIKNYIVNGYARIIPDRFNSVLFTSSYFDLNNLIKLQLKLGQLPYFHGPIIEITDYKVNMVSRDQLKIKSEVNEFEKILNKLIPIQMPKSYLEGFKQVKVLAKKYYPQKVKSIFTANAYSHDDIFKIWAAGQVERNVKLFIGQHGGNLGTCLWSQREDHQIEISDKYFSWGWNKQNDAKVRFLSAGKLLHLRNRFSSNLSGPILSIWTSLPRYFYCSYSIPTAGQFLNYFNYQIELTKLFEPELLKIYKMRLDSPDFSWDLKNRFIDDGLEEYIEENTIKLFDRLNGCRLCVVTHNATVFLETFVANFPTVLFWNPEYYEIRESAKPYFDALHSAGILHYTPESVAKILNKIYHNPMKWWMQENIQSAKDKFCEKYAYISDNWLEEWRNELSSNDTEYYGEEKYPN